MKAAIKRRAQGLGIPDGQYIERLVAHEIPALTQERTLKSPFPAALA
jgi:hypothetical protein